MVTRKHISKYFLLAVIAGVLFAGAFTHITYPCPLPPGEAGCVQYEKAVMHPIDLASNMQGSLVRFLFDLLVGFVTVLVILIALNKLRGSKDLGSKT